MANYKTIIYDNYVSNHFGVMYGENSLTRISNHFPAWKHYFERHLPLNKNAKILDIGCGDGNFVYFLQELGYKNTQGVDVSLQQIESGKKMGISNLLCGDLKQYLNENSQAYDMIIARDVIEHFTKDEVFEIFMLVNKALDKDGQFIIQVPNGQGLFYTSIFYGDYTHEMAYTANSVNQVGLNTGFKETASFPVGPVPKGLVSSIRFFLWKIKVSNLKFWKMVETGNRQGIFTQNLIAVIKK